MPHFKNSNNALFWLDENDDPATWLTSDCVQITDEEAQAIRDVQNQPTEAQKIELCKAEAKTRLTDTDWAVLPDVNIENQAAFVAYRASVRALYLQPVAEPVWPERPEAVWL